MDGITVGGRGEVTFWRRYKKSDDNDSDGDGGGTQVSRRPAHHRLPDRPSPPTRRQTQQVSPFRTPTPEDAPSGGDKDLELATPVTPLPQAIRHPNTPPPSAARTRAPATAPTPRVLTPRWLARLARRAHDGEAWLTVGGVSQAQYDAYSSSHGADAEGEDGRRAGGDLRVEYDPTTGDLAVKCMASPVHDIVGDFFTRATYADSRARMSSGLRIGIQEFRGFDGIDGLAACASKTPDFCIRPRGAPFPTLAVEVGWSESLPKLRADACLFLTGTGGVTRLVVLIKLDETFPATYTVAGRNVTHKHAVTHLKHAMPAGLSGCTQTTLREYYCAHKAALVPPLLGTVSATALVYVRTADAPAECSAPPDDTFPDMTCIDTIPFLADSNHVSTEAALMLPLSAVFPSAQDTHAGSAEDTMAFDLCLLATAILEEVPQMERHRAVKRAAQSIKTATSTGTATAASSSASTAVSVTLTIHPVNPDPGTQTYPTVRRGEKRTASQDALRRILQPQNVLNDDGNSATGVPYTIWKKMRMYEEEEEEDGEGEVEEELELDHVDSNEDGEYIEQSGEEDDEA